MRLIDADTLKEYLLTNLTGDKWGICRMLDAVNDAETIDAVPVVRCKDCEYHDRDDYCSSFHNAYFCDYHNSYWCEYHNNYMTSDDFCSRPKRKEETGNEIN